MSIAELENKAGALRGPLLIRGSVTLTGNQIYIQDRTGALRLRQATGGDRLALGDEIEALGTVLQEHDPVFLATSTRRLWGESMPLPVALDPDQAAKGDLNGFLVQMDGRLLEWTLSADHELHLTIQGRNQIFDAMYASPQAPERLAGGRLERDARLRLTGVLAVQPEITGGVADAPFELFLRGDDDVELLSPPPWWNGEHLAWLALVLLAAGLTGYLRLQQLRAEKLRAILDERSRIARDIHDTLAQGFAGITLQLESAAILLPRDQQAAASALELGLQMVRHSRAESHNAVRVLRSLSRNESLDTLLAKAISELGRNLPVLVEQQTAGEPGPLPYQLTNHLYHIGVQAMANALQHAAANTVIISVSYKAKDVTVCVFDDGRGFDPASALGMSEGHFGLTGMRERAAAISAQLSIHSVLQHGTTIQVVVPRHP